MTQQEYDQLKTTFPWSEQRLMTPQGGLVRVIDNRGQEVPIFTMTSFLTMITNRLIQAKTPE